MNVRDDEGSIRTRATLAIVALTAAATATFATVALNGSERDTNEVSAQGDDEPTDQEEADDVRTIRVQGRAIADVVPDVATVTMGAQYTAPKADEALDTVSKKTDSIIRILKAAGITERDIQTSSLSVWPQYGGEGEQITGYQASNTVTVRTTDLDGLGGLIDQVSKEAGDQFRLDGIAFSVDDPDTALADVRADAVANAKTKAGQFVTGEDLEVGDIRTIIESGSEPPIAYDEMTMAAGDLRAAEVPIEPGSQELVVNVTVVFELI
ncbi:SIMPL domain-containing protein [soil metagenome]